MAAVSSRYARALAEAVSGGMTGAANVDAELTAFATMMKSSADLRNVLTSPAVAIAKKKELLKALGRKMGVSLATQNFLFVLADHKRLEVLDEILPLYRAEM